MFCVTRNCKKSMRAHGITILRGLVSKTGNTFLYVETGTERQSKGTVEATENMQWGSFPPISLFVLHTFHESIKLLFLSSSWTINFASCSKTGTECNYYLVPLGSYLYLSAGPCICLRDSSALFLWVIWLPIRKFSERLLNFPVG